MAKVSSNEQHRYLERIGAYRQAIADLLGREKEALSQLRAQGEDPGRRRIALAEAMLDLSSNYIAINGVSQAILGSKDEDALSDARKAMYRCMIYLESVASNYVDAPFSDYEDKLAGIAGLDAASRYLLVRKTGLAVRLLENAFGDNSRWKWSFVELEGRYAVVAKNIMDLKKAAANTDPRSPDYEPTMYHLRLIKKLLAQAADRYREKYELSTKNDEDFQTGIRFLEALHRLYRVVGTREEAELAKKKIEVWKARLEADVKRHGKAT